MSDIQISSERESKEYRMPNDTGNFNSVPALDKHEDGSAIDMKSI